MQERMVNASREMLVVSRNTSIFHLYTCTNRSKQKVTYSQLSSRLMRASCRNLFRFLVISENREENIFNDAIITLITQGGKFYYK